MSNTSFPELMIKHHGSLENAVEYFRRHTSREPVDARLSLQVLLNILGRETESFRMSEELLTIAPNDKRVLFNRGWHLIRRGVFPEGFRLLDNGRELGSFGDRSPCSRQPIFQRGRKDKCVILVLEGGLGDQIIHARFADTLARELGHGVTLACAPELAAVFARMPSVHSVIAREGVAHMYHDSWIPGMSAPHVLLEKFSDLEGAPYLTANPAACAEWSSLIRSLSVGANLKVGIRWAGSPQFEHQQLRKFPHETVTGLYAVPGVKLFSFQRDSDLFALPEQIVNLGPFIRTWEDTAAALKQMDLLITSCTSVAHMAAALGVRTWVIVPVMPYFIWALPGNTSPWYDSVKIYRQSNYGEWSDVRGRLEKDLKALALEGERSISAPMNV